MIDIELLKNSYPQKIENYSILGDRLKTTIQQILDEKKIHAISSRTKDLDSLIKKILDKNKYNELTEITDLCGIRIITNLESDIEYVSNTIRQNFKIDEKNSLDHRERPVNEFGYLSLHLVVSLSDDRENLAENIGLKELKAEVQVRSILQHAWAEIEHDLGYKNKVGVPDKLQRGSNRLAAILEAADEEFVRLNTLKLKHIQEASSAMALTSETKTLIDSLNIPVLDKENETLKAVRKMLEDKHKIIFVESGNYQNILRKLKFFKINYLEELQKGLNADRKALVKFSDLLFERRDDNRKYIVYEAPLEYYLHFLGSTNDRDYWEDYRYYESEDCKGSITEITDFIQLHKDSLID